MGVPSFEKWLEEIINRLHTEDDHWTSLDEIDEGTLEELQDIYSTHVNTPHGGAKELEIALNESIEIAKRVIFESDGEDHDYDDMQILADVRRALSKDKD
ncbi:MAG: hypothetical protein AN488_20415 [Anabaena sp. WA113]|jgi:hypothetical protein|nr:MAG: hypothetical protein AN488_20415 [Anabaena sp. WA113]